MAKSEQTAQPLVWLALIVATLVVLAPIAVAPLPWVGDYPNHLARMWLLSGGESAPGVSDMYLVRWDTLTNIAIDLIGATIGRFSSYEIAGRLSVALAIVLPPLGGAVLWRAVHGRWHVWALAFALLAWGQSLIAGFLNFQIGIGVALLAAAAEPGLRRGVIVPLVLRAVFAAVLMVCHPFALLFYLILVAALAWGPGVRPDWRQILRTGVLGAVSLVAVSAAFLALTKSPPGTEEHAGLGTIGAAFRAGVWAFERDPVHKLGNALLAFRAYDLRADMLVGAAFALPLLLAVFGGQLRAHGGMVLAAVLCMAAYFAFPDALLGAAWVDTRFAIMAPFALAVALWPDLPRPANAVCAAILAVVALGQTALIGTIWHARQADVAAVARAYAVIPQGAKVLPLTQEGAPGAAPPGRYADFDQAMYWHLPALGLPWRQAFVPIIFAARGKQPIQLRAPWDGMAEPNGGHIADIHALDRPDTVPGLEFSRYVKDWRWFDYVLVLNADVVDRGGPLAPIPGLTQVADEGFARVYRIEKP